MAKKNSKTSGNVSLLEICIFIVWFAVAGFSGYYIGKPGAPDCISVAAPPQQPQNNLREASVAAAKPKCIPRTNTNVQQDSVMSISKHKHHNNLEHLKKQWKCARADLNASHEQIVVPTDGNLLKTKWNSIMSFSPKPFFDRYLAQYPVDTVSHQPVIVFSHKPLKSFEQLPVACKVMDIAVVPDLDNVCVAVTETFHDVASYHMLHAHRKDADSNKFVWTPNNMASRTLPNEGHYTASRNLFSDYFDNMAETERALTQFPRFKGRKTAVGCFVDDLERAELLQNSILSAARAGVTKAKFCIVTTSKEVNGFFSNFGVKVIFLEKLNSIGHHEGVSKEMRLGFIQVWLAYACANKGINVLWQSPGTIWLDRPDNVLQSAPDVETFWVYKGKYDERAGPFFASFDFVGVGTEDRPVHLMHELILHYELALAWDSMDSMVSYRVTENNARYACVCEWVM